jgi:3' terminal RNA ribose 2'-O-methyltransferase Hen1
MLLTISTTHQPATDLGFLLHKHPNKVQTFEITAGKAHVFYPEATENQCTATLLLEIDAIDLVRNLKVPGGAMMLTHYVNDRPYVASSFMSVAISKVFSSALNGNCQQKPELVSVKMPLEAQISVLKVKGGERLIEQIFAPLGYTVEVQRHPLDEQFKDWGNSAYYSIKLRNTLTVKDLLNHLYVLLPVFDTEKHYWVSPNEIEVLLKKGEGWLAQHPEKELITKRFLKNLGRLTRIALAKLAEVGDDVEDSELIDNEEDTLPKAIREKRISLHQQRLNAVLEDLKKSGAKSVLDLGCGEGKLLKMLLKERQFEKILGMDVSFRSLQIAKENLYFEEMSPKQKSRIQLLQGSLLYRDKRLAGYEALVLVEVIEHIEPERLDALARVVFEFAQAETIILTTPNAEYNVKYESLTADTYRHDDHRFEWTRTEFETWASTQAEKYGYSVRFSGIGEWDEQVGAPSQMGVFGRN